MKDNISINIKIDNSGQMPLYLQIASQLSALIKKGDIKPGEKLPPIRKLARNLGVNPITVVNAYKTLEEEGYVYSRIGSGTFAVNHYEYGKSGDIQKFSLPLLEETGHSEFSLMDQGQIQIKPGTINFASATPSPELFPVNEFKEVLNEVLERDKGFAFSYQESQGFYPLRESIADFVELYNINTTPEEIQIISGAQQGIDIISKVLINPGDYIFIESPSYTGAISAFNSRGARLVEIPIKPDGIDLDFLENSLNKQRPKFIYLMPCFQNPTGYLYSEATRKGILDLAERYNFLIIEDDHLSDLNFSNKRVLPLKSSDKNHRVVYIKSFSKIFMPGLRLAFLISPVQIFNDILTAKHSSDISTSGLLQRAFDLYLRKGIFPAHIESTRRIYKQRYDTMLSSLKKFLPGDISMNPPSGGLNFWLRLPEGYISNNLYIECLKKDILFVPGSFFFPSQKPSPYFRLSFAAVNNHEILQGVEVLSRVIRVFLKEYAGIKAPSPTYIPFL
jgi:DNA-binding transcriptional MocR family regulator